MGGAEPGAELGEEDVGANSQQQRLLLNEAVAASIKNTEVEMCQYVRLMRNQFKDVCVFSNTVFPVPTCVSRKVGHFVRVINPLSAKPLIFIIYHTCIILFRIICLFFFGHLYSIFSLHFCMSLSSGQSNPCICHVMTHLQRHSYRNL